MTCFLIVLWLFSHIWFILVVPFSSHRHLIWWWLSDYIHTNLHIALENYYYLYCGVFMVGCCSDIMVGCCSDCLLLNYKFPIYRRKQLCVMRRLVTEKERGWDIADDYMHWFSLPNTNELHLPLSNLVPLTYQPPYWKCFLSAPCVILVVSAHPWLVLSTRKSWFFHQTSLRLNKT